MKNKKLKTVLLFTLILFNLVSLPVTQSYSSENPGYASVLEYRRINGKIVIYSLCKDEQGNNCNQPGSAHIIELPDSIFG